MKAGQQQQQGTRCLSLSLSVQGRQVGGKLSEIRSIRLGLDRDKPAYVIIDDSMEAKETEEQKKSWL